MLKSKEALVIGVVAVIAAIISFVLSGIIFGTPQRNPISVPVVNPINSNFPLVQNDDTYAPFFNNNALDPTQLIQIGNNNNSAPFQNTNQ